MQRKGGAGPLFGGEKILKGEATKPAGDYKEETHGGHVRSSGCHRETKRRCCPPSPVD